MVLGLFWLLVVGWLLGLFIFFECLLAHRVVGTMTRGYVCGCLVSLGQNFATGLCSGWACGFI